MLDSRYTSRFILFSYKLVNINPFPLPANRRFDASSAPWRPLRERKPENRAIGAGQVFSSLFSFVMIIFGSKY